MNYVVKYQTPGGWEYLRPETELAQAEVEFEYYAEYYRYVAIVQRETVTNETVVKESGQA